MTDNTQPEALRLADELEIPIEGYPEATELERNAAAELRRLHAAVDGLRANATEQYLKGHEGVAAHIHALYARIADLEAQLASIGAGGVTGPLVGQPQAMPDMSQLTERGAKAWAGVDARGLREGRWYMVTHDGVATLCEDLRDAEKEAKDADMAWPHSGPHRAVQLVEASTAGFTAADMATASAQGFRDGAASLSASAHAPSEHIKKPYTLAEVKAKTASNDYSAEMLLQHAMLLLDSASLSANAGEPTPEVANLRKALQFYAEGHHFVMHEPTAWDTVSGEPVNFYEDEAGTATVEDGSIAKLVLAGESVNFDDENEVAAPLTAQAEGWRLVPVEPTTDQEWAGKQAALRGSTMAEACKIYKAMLAAAPTPPTSAEGVEHG